jgi:hypothetical protein
MFYFEFGFPKKSISTNNKKIKRKNTVYFPNKLRGEGKFPNHILHGVKLRGETLQC